VFLRKARLLRERVDVRFAFVARYRPVWPTRVMCRLLEVSASGFDVWLDRMFDRVTFSIVGLPVE